MHSHVAVFCAVVALGTVVLADGNQCGNTGESSGDWSGVSFLGVFSGLPLNTSSSTAYTDASSLRSFFLPRTVCAPTALGSQAPSYLTWSTSTGSNTWRGNCTVADARSFASAFAAGAIMTVDFGVLNSTSCACTSIVPSVGVVTGVTFTLKATYSSSLTTYTFYPWQCAITFTVAQSGPALNVNDAFAITYVAQTTDAQGLEQTVLAGLAIAVIVIVIITVIAVLGTAFYMCCCKAKPSGSNSPA